MFLPDEPVYSVFPEKNEDFDARAFRFAYQSLVTPRSVYDCDLATRERTLLKREPVLGGYDPAAYEQARLEAAAPDGTRVPISLVRRKGLPRDGSTPLLLAGYCSYGFSFPVTFDSSRVSLLDRGVAFAVAHVRGGGEMGKRWHDEGRMLRKPNTFGDFVACAEHLVRERWTSPDRLAIAGGSAGGLLVGAVVNMRPGLFTAAVALVPFVDVMNTMLDESLPLTVGEFEEWGNTQGAGRVRGHAGLQPLRQPAGAGLHGLVANAEGQVDKKTEGLLTLDGRPVTTSSMPGGVQKALEGDKAGDYRLYAGPEERFYVLAVQEVIAPTARPFDEVRAEIAKKLYDEKLKKGVEGYAGRLRALSKIAIYLRRTQ